MAGSPRDLGAMAEQTDPKEPKNSQTQAKNRLPTRQEREAAALRENLRRRKTQARARGAGAGKNDSEPTQS